MQLFAVSFNHAGNVDSNTTGTTTKKKQQRSSDISFKLKAEQNQRKQQFFILSSKN